VERGLCLPSTLRLSSLIILPELIAGTLREGGYPLQRIPGYPRLDKYLWDASFPDVEEMFLLFSFGQRRVEL